VSKKNRNNDGFYELKPKEKRTSTVQGSSSNNYNRNKRTSTYGEGNRLKELEERVRTLENHTAELKDLLTRQLDLIENLYNQIDDDDDDRRDFEDPYFEDGIGVRFGGDKPTKMYRLEDPDGELVPKREFAGGVMEVAPGRGFRVGVRFKKK